MLLHCSVPSGGAGRPRTHGYDGSEQAVQAVRLAWPRRESYFCRRQTSRKPMAGGAGRLQTHGYDERNRQCKPSGLHCRGVNRISAGGKHRGSRKQHGMPRVSREASDLYRKSDVRLSSQYCRRHGRQTCIVSEGAIYENCWSNRKSLSLCKTL